MTALTLARLAEIEAAAAKAVVGYAKWYSQNDLTLSECCDSDDATYIALCDPATVAALCRDARRYHYLRNRDNAFVLSTDGPEAGVWCDCESVSGELQLLTERDLDGAIDAALAGDKP